VRKGKVEGGVNCESGLSGEERVSEWMALVARRT
jgi:hypothetical protein